MTYNLARTNYRRTGGIIGCDAIAAGSSSTSAAATAIGTITIAHGMVTAPTFVVGQPMASTLFVAMGRHVGVKGFDGEYMTFITASGAPGSLSVESYVTSAMSSGVAMTFVWAAVK
jgi:hypothetical protein